MSDFDTRHLVQATGEILREQREQINTDLWSLKEQILELRDLNGKEFEKTRSDLLARIDDLNHRYEALSDKLRAVPEDRGEEIAELRGRLLQLERTPGPPGKDGKDGKNGVSPTVEDVANIIVLRHADLLRGEQGPVGAQGPVGGIGAPGKDADPDAVADSLFERHGAELRGEPGQSVSRDEVAAELKQDQQFLTIVRGEKGEPGEPGKQGEPGKSVSRDEVVAELKQDQQFLTAIRGERGPVGERGPEGPTPDVASLIEASMAEFRQREMSEIKAVFARYA